MPCAFEAGYVLEGLTSLQMKGILTDVELVTADNKSFRAHKVVLAAVSPFFRGMFTGDFEENKKGRCELKDISSNTLIVILRAMYEAKLDVNNDNLEDVFAAAHMLQMTKLSDAITSYMLENADVNNCLMLLKMAEKYELEDVLKEAEELFMNKFPIVCERDEFIKLSKEAVIRYLRWAKRENRDSHVNEVVFLRTAAKWIKAENDRQGIATDILKEVNFRLIFSKNLAQELKGLDCVFDKGVCRNLILDAFEYNCKHNEYQKPVMKQNLKAPLTKELCVIGFDESALPKLLQIHLNDEAVAIDFKSMELNFDSVDLRINYAVAFESHIFLFTVRNLGQPRLNGWRYDVNSWECLELQSHAEEAAVVGAGFGLVGEYIMFAGGVQCSYKGIEIERHLDKGYFDPTTLVSVYDIGSNAWIEHCDLPHQVCDAAIASIDGVTYVAGGNFSDLLPDKMTGNNLYSTLADGTWVQKRGMHENRCCFRLDAVGKKLYCVGGVEIQMPKGQRKFVSLVEHYDPLSDQWTTLDKNKVAICVQKHATFVEGDCIYILGGARPNDSRAINYIDTSKVEMKDHTVELPEKLTHIQCVRVDVHVRSVRIED